MSQLNIAIMKNGDQISKIYSGTGALQSGVVVQGKGNLLDKLSDATKSVSRLYLHHFHDQNKLSCIERVLGRSHPSVNVVLKGYQNGENLNNDSVNENKGKAANDTSIRSHQRNASMSQNNEFHGHFRKLSLNNDNDSLSELIIHCGTYNVNGRYPSGSSLIPWLLPKGGKILHI